MIRNNNNVSERPPFILDCTLRDGGFYTDWHFQSELVANYLLAIQTAGISVAEIGYRSPTVSAESGPLRYCRETFLRGLPELDGLSLAVMIDAKAWVGHIDRLASIFTPRAASRISWVRVASRFDDVALSIALCSRLRDLGYATSVNLVGLTSDAIHECEQACRVLATKPVDVVTLADTYGCLLPTDIRQLGQLATAHLTQPWGVHLHDSLELAFANAVEAVACGASWVDCAMLGMGRGPGTVDAQRWIRHLQTHPNGRDLDAMALRDVAQRFFQPLRRHYDWGPSAIYRLCGQLQIHPSYAQSLRRKAQFTETQMADIVGRVHAMQQGARFQPSILERAIAAFAQESP